MARTGMALAVSAISLALFAPNSYAFSLQCTSMPLAKHVSSSIVPINSRSMLTHASTSALQHTGPLPVCGNHQKQALTASLRHQRTALFAEDEAVAVPSGGGDEKLSKLAVTIKNATWLSWWVQVILSVVSMVTLFFANAIKGVGQGNILTNGIFLAGIGLALSFVNVFWTWGYSSMGRNLATSADTSKAIANLRRTIKVGVIVALSGMLVTLFGAEQIVGTLVGKSMSGFLVMGQGTAQAAAMQLQALDILVVQANTNTLLSHWASLVNSLFISTQVPKDKE